MLYFIHGQSQKVFQKSETMVVSLLAKKPDAVVVKLDFAKILSGQISEFVGAQSLFATKYIVVLSRVLEDEVAGEIVMDLLSEIHESENVFIWAEEKVSAKDLKKIEKISEKIQHFEISKKAEQTMNIFDLANAFAERDKKRAWILYVEALQNFSAEEIYGTVWWQVKMMLLARSTKNAAEAGVKDFPYSKARGFLRKYSDVEVTDLARNLISIYHRSRLDGEDLELNLEKLILAN
jgi:DNA polymerase III delta subunit